MTMTDKFDPENDAPVTEEEAEIWLKHRSIKVPPEEMIEADDMRKAQAARNRRGVRLSKKLKKSKGENVHECHR